MRGNGKIIQELEGVFRGAGWNVIKVVWGSGWDKLFAKDKDGLLLKRMEECVDGQYQDFKSKNGAYVREHFFNTPELKALVADLSDEEVWKLNRGGHDPFKVYAAYAAAVKHKGQPTVILAKTVKGYGMGESGEGQMIAHQAKKMTQDALKQFRDRFDIPMPDDKIAAMPFITLAAGQPGDEVPAGAPRGAWRLPAAAPAQVDAPLAAPPLSNVRTPAAKLGRARDLDDDGVRADARHAAARQDDRQAHRADRPRRIAHVRHGRHVPPARHLLGGRASCTSRRMPTSSCTTARTRRARCCRKASTRPARWLVDRRRRRRTARTTCR